MKLLHSIEGDLSQLEERTVLDLMDVLRKVHSTRLSLAVTEKSASLIENLHNIVCDMASENMELVDGNFALNYLNRICHIDSDLLDQDKVKVFVDIFRMKANDPDTVSFLVD